eukprot:gnl/TRDRNA2_/TRDRNA2_189488_c0_seq1.p1 gnl/TRDRNA2_/TRDRNA2_189488_c0~~gnl/TRDRNA2_/TRDRNA2_189488_c0_seq1.p1  ORF type:complete len:368 (+),score=78.13 gnl/TRDRNA2_/TRDRNA2_189488_c0_seq1:81-1184(+)
MTVSLLLAAWLAWADAAIAEEVASHRSQQECDTDEFSTLQVRSYARKRMNPLTERMRDAYESEMNDNFNEGAMFSSPSDVILDRPPEEYSENDAGSPFSVPTTGSGGMGGGIGGGGTVGGSEMPGANIKMKSHNIHAAESANKLEEQAEAQLEEEEVEENEQKEKEAKKAEKKAAKGEGAGGPEGEGGEKHKAVSKMGLKDLCDAPWKPWNVEEDGTLHWRPECKFEFAGFPVPIASMLWGIRFLGILLQELRKQVMGIVKMYKTAMKAGLPIHAAFFFAIKHMEFVHQIFADFEIERIMELAKTLEGEMQGSGSQYLEGLTAIAERFQQYGKYLKAHLQDRERVLNLPPRSSDAPIVTVTKTTIDR